MGAWGAGSFDNDTALDWVFQLDEFDDVMDLMQPFVLVSSVLDEEGYLDSDLGFEALAAAEIVAALAGQPLEELPEEVEDFLAAADEVDDESLEQLKQTARAAVRIVLSHNDSEARQLWEGQEDWTENVEGLIARLV
jgi:hypothetical protein